MDHRALDPHRACALLDPPSRLLPRAFGSRLPPVWNRPPGPASASPACCLPACACSQLSGLPFPDGAPACAFASILPVPSGPFSKLRLAPPPLAQPFRTCLPVPSFLCLACALHHPPVRPACLRFRLQACALRFPLRPRRRLDRLFELSACASCSTDRALSNPTDALPRGHRLMGTLRAGYLCTQVQILSFLWISSVRRGCRRHLLPS